MDFRRVSFRKIKFSKFATNNIKLQTRDKTKKTKKKLTGIVLDRISSNAFKFVPLCLNYKT